jgi:hypothetical protein
MRNTAHPSQTAIETQKARLETLKSELARKEADKARLNALVLENNVCASVPGLLPN